MWSCYVLRVPSLEELPSRQFTFHGHDLLRSEAGLDEGGV